MAEDERVIRLLSDVLAAREDGRALPALLCVRAMDDLRMDGVAATVLSTPEHRHVVYASDDEVVAVEDVQFTLGDGPVIEAYRDSRPVLVPDLRHESVSRWPMFGGASARTPAYAGVFAFPLLVGGAGPIGVLALYRRAPGPLHPQVAAEAQVMAHAVALAVVRQPPAAPDGLHELDDPEALAPSAQESVYEDGLTRWSGSEQVVYQAVGMVVARLRLTPYQALARLRAHAFANDTTLDAVAMAVVERRLRLED